MMKEGNYPMLAKTLQGLEQVLMDELQALGAARLQLLNRAVSFSGDRELMYKANYLLRTAIRVLVPITSFEASNEHTLYKEIQKIPWDQYINYSGSLAIDSTVQSDYYTNSLYVSQKCKDAIVDQFRGRYNIRPDVDLANPDVRINIHIRDKQVTVSLDSSGSSLHLRGYRLQQTEAPMSEVLAAGLIRLSGWDMKSSFVDFMCGSGTLLTEAGMLAYNIAPQKFRPRFGFQTWKEYDQDLFMKITHKAEMAEIEKPFVTIRGGDLLPGAVRIAMQNIEHTGLKNKVQVEISDFADFNPPESRGVLICNPPYGERLQPEDMLELYKKMGDVFKKKYAGYTAWVLSSNDQAMKSIGLRPSRRIPLMNGKLECRFLKFELYEGTKKQKFLNTEPGEASN